MYQQQIKLLFSAISKAWKYVLVVHLIDFFHYFFVLEIFHSIYLDDVVKLKCNYTIDLINSGIQCLFLDAAHTTRIIS